MEKREAAVEEGKSVKADQELSLLERTTPIAKQLNCLDIDKIARVCVTVLPKLIGARLASLYILNDNNGILHLQKHNHPFVINKIVSLNCKPASPMVMAVQSKETILIGDIDRHQQPIIKKSQRSFSGNYQTASCAIAPLICQDKVVGVLNLADKIDKGVFTQDDVALIELFSQLVGASIGNIQLFERIQKQARNDGLTGLANHKTFYEKLEKELWRSKRYGGNISLIMIDIDNLKTLNDNLGHRAGDYIIKETSRIISDSVRQIDTAARYGGDEFAVILPNTSLDEAKVVAERILNTVMNTKINWEGTFINLSVSIGLGQYDCESSPEHIMSFSDQALYSAKKAGKGRVEIFEMCDSK